MPFSSASPENLSGDNLEDANLLKAILPPLLDDFQHWFERTVDLLETQPIPFLAPDQQQALLKRVNVAQQQVSASKVLASATDNQAGIDMPVVMAWHQLVHECWGVAIRFRKESSPSDSLSSKSIPENDANP
ncbi:MAG: DUF2605 domain-containing protein [Phormidesmis priestleyi]|uniref:DUF2605 domain-containing protein n=1 Tax=Phormidesmis priestleyi TaxID=268141 RepID=A0A2W4XXQ1_9CYAN|nr:MAG: DUF2605 domain-containing protein [Phormidesmis priestleyi]